MSLFRWYTFKHESVDKPEKPTDQEIFSSNATIEFDVNALGKGGLSSMSAAEYQDAAHKLQEELPAAPASSYR